jgi:hypothetical protein
MIHDAASEKLFAEAASRQAAKIGVIASPFLAVARPNSNSLDRAFKWVALVVVDALLGASCESFWGYIYMKGRVKRCWSLGRSTVGVLARAPQSRRLYASRSFLGKWSAVTIFSLPGL